MDDVARKAGRNEMLFREINERIRELGDVQRIPAEETWDFLCECADETCAEIVPLTVAEYEAIRIDATRFPLKPGHERPAYERVVERHERYVVVEKLGEAAAVAVESDPRAETAVRNAASQSAANRSIP